MFDWTKDPHRRFNPLTREWVLVSPHRTERPWQGQVEKDGRRRTARVRPELLFVPGNSRAGGLHNPAYDATFVFDNDFAALKPDTPLGRFEQEGLLLAEAEPGLCRVVCFSPRHNLTIANMDAARFAQGGGCLGRAVPAPRRRAEINYVQIFENRGAMMGASNPHPHGQIWSSQALPNEVAKEQASLLQWRERRGTCMLCEYARLEQAGGERVVEENEAFLTVVPFWAVWPFETMVIAKRHLCSIEQLTGEERDGLADILKRTTARYDRLFNVSFPYSMGFHQRPTDGAAHDEHHLHLHFYPPLLRSATVRKFLVGYEMLATPQRDITAESAASRLRGV